jgi:uncharacterized membrane protein YhaH (DUF805 family)
LTSAEKSVNLKGKWRRISFFFACLIVLLRSLIEFAVNEQRAEEIFRRAIQLENPSQIKTALGLYRTIVKDFSGTLAAQMAEERMRMLKQLLQN